MCGMYLEAPPAVCYAPKGGRTTARNISKCACHDVAVSVSNIIASAPAQEVLLRVTVAPVIW